MLAIQYKVILQQQNLTNKLPFTIPTFATMFKTLDWYIIRNFLGTFFFTVLLFLIIAVVIDLSEKVDDFVEKKAPIDKIVFQYYLSFIPHIAFLLFPIFVFITVIFFTSKLAGRSEIVAAYGSGISFYRILLVPYLICALILTGIQLYANHYLVPYVNTEMLDFDNTYLKKGYYNRNRNFHFQVDTNAYVYVENYNVRDSVGYKFAFEKIVNKKLVYKIRADRMKWKTDHWEIKNFYKRYINGLDEKIERGTKMDTTFNLLPEDFGKTEQNKDMMSTPELKVYLEKERKKGVSGLEIFEVEIHRRTAIPFATLLLTALGFAIASRKVRGGMGLHLAFGVGLSAAYIVLLQFSITFATQGGLKPFLGSWMPNLIFATILIYLLKVAQK